MKLSFDVDSFKDRLDLATIRRSRGRARGSVAC